MKKRKSGGTSSEKNPANKEVIQIADSPTLNTMWTNAANQKPSLRKATTY
jgi:hypothetical protein